MAWLHAHGDVVEQTDGEDGTEVTVRLAPADVARFEKRFAATIQRPGA